MDYNEKRLARIKRFKEQAEKLHGQSDSVYESTKQKAVMIPLGQPILVGHHSEKGDRAFRSKIENGFRKSFELQKKAEYYEEKAEAAENNRAIYSDDPEAITKLRKQLENAEKMQECMKFVNKMIKNTKLSKDEKISQIEKEYPFMTGKTIKLFEPDCFGLLGFASFALTNNSANIRRLKDRITELENTQKAVYKEIDKGIFKIVENPEENRIQLLFNDKPSEEIRSILKHNGFRWSPSNMAWQRNLNNPGRYAADNVYHLINGL